VPLLTSPPSRRPETGNARPATGDATERQPTDLDSAAVRALRGSTDRLLAGPARAGRRHGPPGRLDSGRSHCDPGHLLGPDPDVTEPDNNLTEPDSDLHGQRHARARRHPSGNVAVGTVGTVGGPDCLDHSEPSTDIGPAENLTAGAVPRTSSPSLVGHRWCLMSEVVVERRRTGWDIVFGVLLVVAGLIILGDVVVATIVSVLFLGWLALFSGIIALVAALFRIGKGGFWSTALSGGLLAVLGLMFLRHTGVAALTLTLLAGSLFLVSVGHPARRSVPREGLPVAAAARRRRFHRARTHRPPPVIAPRTGGQPDLAHHRNEPVQRPWSRPRRPAAWTGRTPCLDPGRGATGTTTIRTTAAAFQPSTPWPTRSTTRRP
jgi:short repeat uncharacterized protein DUF308